MILIDQISEYVLAALHKLYHSELNSKDFQLSQTKPEFEGDYTVVLFSLVKSLKKSPDQIGNDLGKQLVSEHPSVLSKYNILKGFLNLSVTEQYWIEFLEKNYANPVFGTKAFNGQNVMVEYSSPNTNKPLHLGHLRNNFLGWSVAEILKANGYNVTKTCVVNDRGIHICKSMLSWRLFAHGASPQSTGMKGDHFVGDYYVKFNDELSIQIDQQIAQGVAKESAEKEAPIMKATQQMLQDWEEGKPEVIDLWKTMNGWVYDGFAITYKRIGSDFDKTYFESQTYLLGKEFVQEGLSKGQLFKKEDNSIWVDLSSEGLEEKLVMRKDGTSVYITQDIGLAQQKFEEYATDKSIYVIGDEQIHHMKVLKAICRKLGFPFADNIHHLSYGMVELTTGKMKSREGTVVDADDLMDEMVATAKRLTEELGKVKDFEEKDLSELYEVLGLGAMKFYLLRVDPKKRMVFNPEESIDFHGYTGPFIQYTYARIQSILKKINSDVNDHVVSSPSDELYKLEKALIYQLELYPFAIREAAEELNPSIIANYTFNLAKAFNSFYAEHLIANAESEDKKQLRLRIASMTANVIASAMHLLGIRVPARM